MIEDAQMYAHEVKITTPEDHYLNHPLSEDFPTDAVDFIILVAEASPKIGADFGAHP